MFTSQPQARSTAELLSRAAWHSTQLVAGLLFGLEAGDLTAFIAAPVVLAAVALAASYLPARRAARVSPLTAMRVD